MSLVAPASRSDSVGRFIRGIHTLLGGGGGTRLPVRLSQSNLQEEEEARASKGGREDSARCVAPQKPLLQVAKTS